MQGNDITTLYELIFSRIRNEPDKAACRDLGTANVIHPAPLRKAASPANNTAPL